MTALEGVAAGQLLPHMLEHWPALLESAHANVPPTIDHGGLSEQQRAELVRYTRRIGPLATEDTRRVGAAIGELIETNTHAVNGSKRVLLVNGPSTMGKSQAVTSFLLRESGRIWAQGGRRVGNAEVIPFLYTEIGATGSARAMMTALLEFIGLPIGPRESAEQMLSRFRRLAGVLGVQAVVIDDAHMLRTVSREARQLTDFLKGMITSLPVSFVFVGAGLDDSALLRQSTGGGYSAAEQIARRATVVQMQPWPHTAVGDAWTRLVANLEAQLVLPTGSARGNLTSAGALRILHERSAGHPGLMIDWVKRAAVQAITTDQRLTLAALKSTAPPKPTRGRAS